MGCPQKHDANLLRAAFVLVKELMCVRKGESVLIATDSDTDRGAAEALQQAACVLDAKVATIVLANPLPFQGGLADPFLPDHVAAALSSCDVCIDLCMPYIAGSHASAVAMKNKRTRYFLGADIGSGGLLRLFGDTKLEKVFAVSECFHDLIRNAAGRSCHVTSRAGTNVMFSIAPPEGFAMSKATAPGGYYVPGTALFIPDPDSVKGRIVCEATFHEYYTLLTESLVFEVDGQIRSVSGGGTELAVIDRALRRAGGGDYGNVVHFTCGFHPSARFTGHSFVEDQRVVGCNAIGFGIPHWLPGGGENHPDCVVKSQSLWIEGEQIVRDGVIVGPAALTDAVDNLARTYR